MSKKQTKRYETSFKVKVVLEALKEEITLNELCTKYEVVPVTVRQWKEEFLANAELAFEKEKAVKVYKEKIVEKEREIDELHRGMGKLSAQLEWAKKKSKELGLEY